MSDAFCNNLFLHFQKHEDYCRPDEVVLHNACCRFKFQVWVFNVCKDVQYIVFYAFCNCFVFKGMPCSRPFLSRHKLDINSKVYVAFVKIKSIIYPTKSLLQGFQKGATNCYCPKTPRQKKFRFPSLVLSNLLLAKQLC